jgi:hypothetical protein
MYGNTRKPPCNSNDYEIGKVAIGAVAIHRLVIVAMPPHTSSNHAVRTRRAVALPTACGRYQRSSATEFESVVWAGAYPLAVTLDSMCAGTTPEG